MAIKVSGTTVIDNSRQLSNIASIDSATATTLKAAGLGASTNLYGDPIVYSQTTNTYAITNYRIDGSYAVSVGTGSALVSGQNITYSAPEITSNSTTTLTITLTLDGNDIETEYTLQLRPKATLAPTASISGGANNQNLVERTYNTSEFVFAGGVDTHASTDWQLASDSSFSNILFSSINDTSNLTSIVDTTALSVNTTYYLRARYTSSTFALTSEYSDTVTFTTANAQVNTPTITGVTEPSWSSSAYSVTGTTPSGDSHESTTWYLYSDDGTTLVHTITEDTSNLTSISFADFAAAGATLSSGGTYYVKAKYHSSTLGASNVSGTGSFGGSYQTQVEAADYSGGIIYNNCQGVFYRGPDYSTGATATFTYRYFMDGARITAVGGGGGTNGNNVHGGAGGGSGFAATCTLDAAAAGLSDGDTVTITVGDGGNRVCCDYRSFSGCEVQYWGCYGCTSSFGTIVSACGGYGGGASNQGGLGGKGMTGGAGASGTNQGCVGAKGGHYDCECGRGQNKTLDYNTTTYSDRGAYSPSTLYGDRFSTPGCWCGGAGGDACCEMQAAVLANVTGSCMGNCLLGCTSGGSGSVSAGAMGGVGVAVTGIPLYTTPSNSGSPNYGPSFSICNSCGYGAGGRGGLGDAGGGAGGSNVPFVSTAGTSGFVAIEWD